MIGDLILLLAFAVVVLVSAVTHPQRSRCPRGWYAEGVRDNGSSRCRPSPPQQCGDARPPYDAPCPRDDRELPMRVYCTNGTRPVVVDDRAVGCQR